MDTHKREPTLGLVPLHPLSNLERVESALCKAKKLELQTKLQFMIEKLRTKIIHDESCTHPERRNVSIKIRRVGSCQLLCDQENTKALCHLLQVCGSRVTKLQISGPVCIAGHKVGKLFDCITAVAESETQYFCLKNACLMGSLKSFIHALSLHNNLRIFELVPCRGFQNRDLPNCHDLVLLAATLVGLQNIEEVRLDMRQFYQAPEDDFLESPRITKTFEALTILCSSKILQRLELRYLPRTDLKGFSEFCKAVKHSASIRKIELQQCALSRGNIEMLGGMIRGNRTLEEFVIFECFGARMKLDPLVEALDSNLRLREINVQWHGPGIAFDSQWDTKLLEILKNKNSILEWFSCNFVPRSGREQIDFYLKLNRTYQRKKLLLEDTMTLQDLLDMLPSLDDENIDDLPMSMSVTYALLLMKPSLWLPQSRQ